MEECPSQMMRIEDLPQLTEGAPDYVRKAISGRVDDLKKMPNVVQSLIATAHTILDVGRGEGVGSIALAQYAPNARVRGIEMDQLHLQAAWPYCTSFGNQELCRGALPETPSSTRVNKGFPTPSSSHPPGTSYDILFSWLGMSRRDIFVSGNRWCHLVNNACILVVPRFWREGMGVLDESEQEGIGRLCRSVGIPQPSWEPETGIPGFARMDVYPIEKKVEAQGWILWLTGIFDSSNMGLLDRKFPCCHCLFYDIFDSSKVSLLDTLKDQHQGQKSPGYGRPDLHVGLEVLIGYKT